MTIHTHMTGVGGRWTRLDLPVWVALAVMLGIGSALIGAVEARTIPLADPQGGLRIHYPAGWIATPGAPGLLDVQDPLSGAAVPTRLIVTRGPRAAGQTLSQIAGETVLSRTQQFAMYRVLGQRDMRIGGKNALAIDYAFVADPHETVLAAQRLPVVMRGTEVVVLTDAVVYFIDVRATAAIFDRERSTIKRILRGIRLGG